MKYLAKIQSYIMNTDGITAIEYSFLAGGIALATLAGMTIFAEEFTVMQSTISDYMQSRL